MSAARTLNVKACMLLGAAGLSLLYLCSVHDAHAAGPLGTNGQPIRTSKYGVDMFQGPILATTRITAIGGAFTPIAEGTEGIPFNPAAASFRMPYSSTKTDYDLTAGLTLPSSVKGTDFDNNGKSGFAYETFYWLTFGGMIQFGNLGMGVIGSFQNYQLGVLGTPAPLDPTNTAQDKFLVTALAIRLVRLDPVISYAFADDQLHVGAGLRVAGVYMVGRGGQVGEKADQERLLINQNTAGAQGGALWAPRNLPLRVGAVIRSPAIQISSDEGRIGADKTTGDRVFNNIYLPEKLELPYEIEAGVAVQFWKRPFNLPWHDEDKVPEAESERWRRTVNGQIEPSWRGARRLLKSRYRELPRERVTLSTSVLLSGPVPNSVGIESMLSQVVERSGEQPVVTIRGGAEAEVVPNWFVVRLGSYLEPTRYDASKVFPTAECPDTSKCLPQTRLHGTAGFALRTIRWDVFGLVDEDTIFRVSGSLDYARDYFGWGVGAGLWM